MVWADFQAWHYSFSSWENRPATYSIHFERKILHSGFITHSHFLLCIVNDASSSISETYSYHWVLFGNYFTGHKLKALFLGTSFKETLLRFYNFIIIVTPGEGQLYVDVHVFGVFNISQHVLTNSLGSVGVLRWGNSEQNYRLVVIPHRRWNQDPRLKRWRQYCLSQHLWVMCKKALCSDALFNEKLLPFDFLSPSTATAGEISQAIFFLPSLIKASVWGCE